jgi:hypothetical protein
MFHFFVISRIPSSCILTRPDVLIQFEKVFKVSHWPVGRRDKVLLILPVYKFSSTQHTRTSLEDSFDTNVMFGKCVRRQK